MTVTGMMHMKNSRDALKRPHGFVVPALGVLEHVVGVIKPGLVHILVCKRLGRAMPEMQDSMSALMDAIFCLTCREASAMLRRHTMTTTRKMGMITATTRASRHSMENMDAQRPHDGEDGDQQILRPVWDSSVISKRSPVRRFISFPVRLAS